MSVLDDAIKAYEAFLAALVPFQDADRAQTEAVERLRKSGSCPHPAKYVVDDSLFADHKFCNICRVDFLPPSDPAESDWFAVPAHTPEENP